MTLFDGTGAYAGIGGTVPMATSFAEIGPRFATGPKKGQCNMSNNAEPVSQFMGDITGSGTFPSEPSGPAHAERSRDGSTILVGSRLNVFRAATGLAGVSPAPCRHHVSRRSSNLQAMAYTMPTKRHMTPKPGQGWSVWAEW